MGECIFNVFSCEIVYLEQGIEGSDVFIQLSLSCYDLELCIRDFRIYITRSRLCYEGLPYIHVQICVMYEVDINSRKLLHYLPPKIISSQYYAAREFSVEMQHGIYIIPLDFTIGTYSRDLLQAPDIIQTQDWVLLLGSC